MIRLSALSIWLILSVGLTGCATVPALVDGIPTFADAFQDQRLTLNQEATPLPAPLAGLPSLVGLESLDEGLVRIYEQVNQSVVHIETESTGVAPGFQLPEIPNLPLPFSEIPNAPAQPRSGLGSGVVWDKAGHIVTNNHVVEGAETIMVTFYDGTRAAAEWVGADRNSDLAVVRVDVPADRLHPVAVADSTEVRVGQLAIALGNPFGLQGTMTTGVISALGRSLPVNNLDPAGPGYTIPDVIQTDAPINPGNSGGALVDSQGRLLGIPTAIESPVRANAGIGFVVPSVIVSKVVPALIEQGFYEHPWIGISGRSLLTEWAREMDLDPNQRGALIVEVVPDSPAAEAGLRGSDRLVTSNGVEIRLGGDVIIQIDDQPVSDFEDLVAHLARYTEAGQRVDLTLLRDGQREKIPLTLGTRPGGGSAEASPPIGVSNGQAWLGIVGADMNPAIAAAMGLSDSQQGVLIEQLLGDSPAAAAGLRGSFMSVHSGQQRFLVGGDIIVAIDGEPISDLAGLQAALRTKSPGDRVVVQVLRDGAAQDFDVELTAKPDS